MVRIVLEETAPKALGLVLLVGGQGGVGRQDQEAIAHLRLPLSAIILSQFPIDPYSLVGGSHDYLLPKRAPQALAACHDIRRDSTLSNFLQ